MEGVSFVCVCFFFFCGGLFCSFCLFFCLCCFQLELTK